MSKAVFYKIILSTVVSVGISIDVLRMNYVKSCYLIMNISKIPVVLWLKVLLQIRDCNTN